MNVKITGRKANITDTFKERIEKKLSKFDRIFGNDTDAFVTITFEKNRQTVEVTIKRGGMVYRAEQTRNDIIDALDEVVEILGRQIRKNKAKLEKRLRTGLLDEVSVNSDSNLHNETEEKYDIIRKKLLPIKPLSVEEAILQMNMVSHQFYMFVNQETDKVNVVYRRRNGGYGLLEPDLN